MQTSLFEPFSLRNIKLSNRIVMAPLTRRRADNPALAADDMVALYYQQRATAGLIISEGSQISPQAYGYTGSPGCYTQAQMEGWKKVTETLHRAGGKIFLQLWHVGPFSHASLQPGNKAPVSASPVTPEGDVLTPDGRVTYESSRAMTKDEIFQTVKEFALAAQNAIKAGFDGVEVHGAHAYIIDQFIMDGTNKRSDEFGGSVENRARFLFMILDEILKQIPSGRVGLRLSPRSVKKGMEDSTPDQTYGYIVNKLKDYNLAYLHISEMMTPEMRMENPNHSIIPYYREIYNGTLISCGGHTLESANRMLENNEADLIAFGKPFISNPDLAERLRNNAELTPWDKETFYHGGSRGYIDYPMLQYTDI
ncbi:MAG: alkene reductase [Bacteroidetes bacterium]|nr:MAG: alkene reductase [Bacteroidota bacterium]